MHDIVHLDHSAMSPVRPEVVAAMAECYREFSGNPASEHRLGRAARERLEQARSEVARLLGARLDGDNPDRVIFTSGCVEANNLAILGIARARLAAGKRRLVIGAMEHSSVLAPAEHLMEQGWRLDTLSGNEDGRVRLAQLSDWLSADTSLVSILLVNHETGVLQPVREAATLAHARGVPLHSDAAQAVGKTPVDFESLGIDSLALSAQKFEGPPAAGALLLRHETPIAPLWFGGSQQTGLRPGTESVALATGLALALRLRLADLDAYRRRVADLRDRFEQMLRLRLPTIVIHGRRSPRIPDVTNIAFPGLDAVRLVARLDASGVVCSVGSACDREAPSPTLRAMGLPAPLVRSSIRFSLGRTTTKSMIDAAVERIVRVVEGEER